MVKRCNRILLLSSMRKCRMYKCAHIKNKYCYCNNVRANETAKKLAETTDFSSNARSCSLKLSTSVSMPDRPGEIPTFFHTEAIEHYIYVSMFIYYISMFLRHLLTFGNSSTIVNYNQNLSAYLLDTLHILANLLLRV